MQNLIGLAGIAVILGIAFLFSSNRRAINLRVVVAAFLLRTLTPVEPSSIHSVPACWQSLLIPGPALTWSSDRWPTLTKSVSVLR